VAKSRRAAKSPKKRRAQKKASHKKTANKQVPEQEVAVTEVAVGGVAAVQAPATPLTRVHARPARALIGWLPPDVAKDKIAGPGAQPPYTPDVEARVANAHAAVAARVPHAVADNVVTDAPPELDAYIAELRAQPFFRPFNAEGWEIKLADLRLVRAVQPVVHTDHSAERAQGAQAGDLLALAGITLPTTRAVELMAAIPSADGRGWMITCRNPQLRILGSSSAARDDNGYKTTVFGIGTEIVNSLVQVTRWRGAYVLRDGYHRTHGLLSRGITSVPVVYKEYPDHQPPVLAPGKLFDPDVYAGDRAPLLLDYLDDEVSAPIELRREQKTFVIQIQVTELDVPIL
jgi:hypothetical protein